MSYLSQLSTNLLDNKILVLDAIGQGGFGSIYRGIDLRKNREVAIKIESINAEFKLLHKETTILKKLRGKKGFTPVIAHGKTENFQYLVIELLGISLDNFYAHKKGKLPLCKLLKLFTQLLQRLESLHKAGFTHNDIKPANCVIGSQNSPDRLFLIDFGFCQQVTQEGPGQLAGTPRFQSIRSHFGQRTTYTDDIESLLYCLVCLHNGKLPWDFVTTGSPRRVNEAIIGLKAQIVPKTFFASLPPQILKIYEHIMSVDFGILPNYKYMLQQMKQAIKMTPKRMQSKTIFQNRWHTDAATASMSAERVKRFKKCRSKTIISLKVCTNDAHSGSDDTIVTNEYPYITPRIMKKIQIARQIYK